MIDNSPSQTDEPYRLSEQMEIDMATLAIQERVLIERMGGLFPQRENSFAGFTRVLDIACGTGAWAVRVARENPRLEAIGLASQRVLRDYAEGLAQAQEVENARFYWLRFGEVPELPFPDQAFDLVQTHYLHAWLRPKDWPGFLKECSRVTRPGGYLCMTEPEWGGSTSLALDRLIRLSLRALQKAGQLLSPDARQVGAGARLGRFVTDAGWIEVTQHTCATDYGMGVAMPQSPEMRIELLMRPFRSLILREGVATEDEMRALMMQASIEAGREDFRASRLLVSVCGRKPGAAEVPDEGSSANS